MIRRLDVPLTDAKRITWLRNSVQQKFISSVEDKDYSNADDFEEKLKTCAYSLAYRDGAFSNERDAYRRTEINSEDEQSDVSTGTRRKKRQTREQRMEEKLCDTWKKALTSIGREKAQQVPTTPIRCREDEYYEFPFLGPEAPDVASTGPDEPDVTSGIPDDETVRDNGWNRNRRRREEEPPASGKRVRFSTAESEEASRENTEDLTKKLTERLLQQKVDITIQELFELAPYCKELMMKRLIAAPDRKHEEESPTVTISSVSPWIDTGPVVQVQIKGMTLPNRLVDGGSRANVISAQLYSKLKGLQLLHAPFNLQMADQRRVLPLGVIKNYPSGLET
ncbi:hypothetical protein R1sor_006231 [Riccia sorocarpa]|uniref:Uncharacterized protein n=1 Tax=Riccia sorocarpa TaxID=122646 RepID=A0ABD3HLT7_9MARC